MKLTIVTPEKEVYASEIAAISLPTPEGEITVLPHHIPLITQIAPGELIITKIDNNKDFYATGGGFAEITGDHIAVLTDLAEHAAAINEKAVEEARQRAQEALAKRGELSDEEVAFTEAALLKSLVQLRVVRRHHGAKLPTSQS